MEMIESDFFKLVNENNSKAHTERDGDGFGIIMYGLNESSKILGICLEKFPPRFNFIRITDISFDWGHNIEAIWVSGKTKPEIQIYTNPELDKWKNIYSYEEYFTQIEKIAGEEYEEIIEFSENDQSEGLIRGIAISVKGISLNSPIIIEIERVLTIVKNLHLKAAENLSKNDEYSVAALFRFPEDIKSSCEQYLLYFVQFLRDSGINATSNLKEEAGKVLFLVAPTDDIEALDNIREALAVYLNLPSSPIVYDESFAAMRLHQQIDNLQHSQRMVARELQFNEKLLIAHSETIREKNITISQLQSANEQQHKFIEKISSKSIMMDSVENKEEFEKVFDGLEFGASKELTEKLGIKFNPVTSLKSLGNKFIGKDDEIISLDLDKNE